MLGIPGASVLGPPLDAGVEIADAAVSPRQDYALVLTGQTRDVQVLRFPSDRLVLRALSGVMAAPDRMQINSSGSAAALYYQATGTAQIVTGLPDTPVLSREVALSGAGQQITALAISDDSQALMANLAGSATIVVAGADGSATAVKLGNSIRALAFRPYTQDAAAATADNQVLLLPDITNHPRPQMIAGQDAGIAGPVAVEFSADGQRLFAANAATGTVAISDLTLGTTTVLGCGCNPSGLSRLKGTAIFRLTEFSSPLLLFDGNASPPRILFVPPDQSAGLSGAEFQGSGQ